LPRKVGITAAITGAVIPIYLLNEFRSTTSVFGALCMMCLALMTAWLWKVRPNLSAWLGFIFGVSWGISLLIAPNLLIIGFVWLLATMVRSRSILPKFTTALFATALAIMSPWAIRNAKVLGSPVLFRSNLGLELWIANNDLSAPAYKDNGPSQKKYQPFVNEAESESFRRIGEVNYMHQDLDKAILWIKEHPRRFADLTVHRVLLYWFPLTYRAAQTVVMWLLIAAAVVGLCFAWKRQPTMFWILGAILLAYPLVYYLVQLDNPYRYPMYWSLLLLAAYGCACVVGKFRRYTWPLPKALVGV
jgi:hypothetical protein